ncbi:GH92 family glycosyl hydrolase [Sediminitomix flava]|uniref:Putative alpha-1,2-mannosidase n=1 Tax=Sediminitomix flava TaxID=379075 RepID=A0A315ZBM3_SEDFL|nr:GH92 family glycosyl hydrolase [Sediminitomix flava]PWJ42188.1 putative alpha-1,2-mannosidase [Sediminitomix flava]
MSLSKNIIRVGKAVLALWLTTGLTACETQQDNQSLIQYVNPFIGTGGHGHTFPGATLPFGGVQVSPVNGQSGWDWVSGYHYSDSLLVGFGHLHLSGTGIGDLNDILILPTTQAYPLDAKINQRDKLPYLEKYTHANEVAQAGYYKTHLLNSDIIAEVTAGKRVGFHQWTFPENTQKPSAIIDLGFAVNWDGAVDTEFEQVDKYTLRGKRFSKGWAEDQRVFFQVKTSEEVEKVEINKEGKRLVAQVFFKNTDENKQVRIAVGISSASYNGAHLALLEEANNWTFEEKKKEAQSVWEKALNQVQITSSDEKQKEIFYTALYHSKIAPVTHSDAEGFYKGADHEVHKTKGGDFYSTFSLWDTFRAVHPLFTILEPEKFNADLINSMLAHYDQTGILPVWALAGNETNCMTGYHSMPVLADAVLKGIKGIDAEKVFEAMKATSLQDARGLKLYKEYGFIPADLEDESVTTTLEYAYDDWCIAQVAKHLGKEEDYKVYMKRSEGYKPLFDKETGFMRGRQTDGTFRTPFDPKEANHRENTDYTEGNAFQHSWFVLHDVQGLINMFGSNEAFVAKLDELFTESSEISGEHVSPDISGMIGQYAHGNEPSHHIAYLYNYAGQAWKTQEKVREILETQYDNTPDGISGNEDCGQMSAWYVFSSAGLYPVNPANGYYDIGSPLFENVKLNTSSGKTFEIISNNVSDQNIYIQSASLNGEPLNTYRISHKQLMNGGTLVLEMGPKPLKEINL